MIMWLWALAMLKSARRAARRFSLESHPLIVIYAILTVLNVMICMGNPFLRHMKSSSKAIPSESFSHTSGISNCDIDQFGLELPWTGDELPEGHGVDSDNPLLKWFRDDQKTENNIYIQKWTSYLPTYHRYLEKYREKDVHVLEISLDNPSSKEMWKAYFGDKAKINGVDNNTLKDDGDRGDAYKPTDITNTAFLRQICDSIPRIDIIIDNGIKLNWQKIHAFKVLYPCLAAGGLYFVEGIYSSYTSEYGGGYCSGGSFMDYTKTKIDQIETFWSCGDDIHVTRDGKCKNGDSPRVPISAFGRTAAAIHIHDGIVVFEKTDGEQRHPPQELRKGERRTETQYGSKASLTQKHAQADLKHLADKLKREAEIAAQPEEKGPESSGWASWFTKLSRQRLSS